QEGCHGCMDDEFSPDGGPSLRLPLESVRLDDRGPRPHGPRGVRGGRLAGSAPGAHRQPAGVLRDRDRRARAGVLHVGARRPAGAGHGRRPLRALLGAERRHPVGHPARVHGRVGDDDLRGHRGHVRCARALRLDDEAQPGGRRAVLHDGPGRPHSRLDHRYVLAQRRPAVPDLGSGRHRLHRSHRVGRAAAQADGAGAARRTGRRLRRGRRALPLSRLHQPLPDAAALYRQPARLAAETEVPNDEIRLAIPEEIPPMRLFRAPGCGLLAALATAAPAMAAPEGQMPWGVHISLSPTWFDPAETQGIITPFMVLYAIHDAMAKAMPGNTAAPSLAESWQVSPDGRVYDFTLRKGVKFHNGDPLTSEDVEFSFERDNGGAVETPDALHVKFRLKNPWPDFMTFYTAASGAGWIVPKKYVEKVGDEGFKKAPIGAGPYKFVSFSPGVELVMEAFDGYWRKTPN